MSAEGEGAPFCSPHLPLVVLLIRELHACHNSHMIDCGEFVSHNPTLPHLNFQGTVGRQPPRILMLTIDIFKYFFFL